MVAFIASFIQYLIIMAVLIVLAVLGVKIGSKMRINKDAKDAAAANAEGVAVDKE